MSTISGVSNSTITNNGSIFSKNGTLITSDGSLFKAQQFLPTDIANIALWLDAADSSTITSTAGAVSQWDDKSGNNNHATQSVSAEQPTTGVLTTNGYNVIRFDGTELMDLTNNISQTSGYTIFIASSHLISSLFNKTIITGATGSFSLRIDTGGRLDAVRTGEVVLINGTISVPIDSQILSTYVSSAGTGVQIGGVSDGSNSTDAALTQPINNIGGNSGSFANYNGGLGEVLTYTRVLTNTEMNQVGNYLKSKWGAPWTNI